MKVVKKLSEQDFELQFLTAEWYKSFYDPWKDKFKELITKPDTADWQQNYLRKELLWKWRYPLLGQLPINIDWHLIKLRLEEFENLLVIKEDGWNRTFGLGTTLLEAATAVRNNVPDMWGVNFRQIQDIKNNIGKYDFKEKIILISSDMDFPYTVVEGNHRAVAFELRKIESGESNHVPKEFLLGVSPNMGQAFWLNTRTR